MREPLPDRKKASRRAATEGLRRGAPPAGLGCVSSFQVPWAWRSVPTCAHTCHLHCGLEPTRSKSASVSGAHGCSASRGASSVSGDPRLFQLLPETRAVPQRPLLWSCRPPDQPQQPLPLGSSDRRSSSHLVLRSQSVLKKKKYCKSKLGSLQMILKRTRRINAAISFSHGPPLPKSSITPTPFCPSEPKFSLS